MKKIFMAVCILAATFTGVTSSRAQSSFSTSVSVSDFTTRVYLMDSLIGAGSMTMATSTWNDIHNLLMAELANTKSEIAGASSASDRATYTTIMNNQYSIYQDIWALKADLTTNRAAIKTKLLTFAATI